MSRRFCALPPGAMAAAAATAAAAAANGHGPDGFGSAAAAVAAYLEANTAGRDAAPSRMDVEREPSPYKQRHSEGQWRSDSEDDEGASQSGSLQGRRLRRRLADLSAGSEEEAHSDTDSATATVATAAAAAAASGEGDCLSAWIDTLSLVQHMSPQTRRLGTHVEYVCVCVWGGGLQPPPPSPPPSAAVHTPHPLTSPPHTRSLLRSCRYEGRDWMYAFNVNISLSSVFEYLVGWVRKASHHDEAAVAHLLHRALGSVAAWQYRWLGPQAARVSLPLHPAAWDAVSGDTHAAVTSLDMWRDAGGASPSFHILLHRFCANVIAETCKSPALIDLMGHMATHATGTAAASVHAVFSPPPRGRAPAATGDGAGLHAAYAAAQGIESAGFGHDLGLGLIELPLSALLLAAQVRIGMWRRNGHAMQVSECVSVCVS